MEIKDDGENTQKKDWSVLLPELLQLVMSCLIVKDNIRASAVCKTWYQASISILMKHRHLWFLQYPLSSRIKRPCELYDPLQNVTYNVDLPEIVGMMVYYSKDGWMLMGKGRMSSDLFFFNLFTRKLISLPSCQSYNECVIFTCAPTSSSCLVFGLANIENRKKFVAINTFRLGETKWKTTYFPSPELCFAYNNKIIFSRGLFYCLGGLGWLAVFDPSKRTWNARHLKCFASSTTTWFGTYLVEIKGDIFLLKTSGEKLRVFKLNCDDETWICEEKDRFDEGLTIFGASRASEPRSYLPSYMRNKLFLSDSHHPMINTYFFDEERYSPRNSYISFWEMKTVFQSIWIEPPKLSLDFI